MLLDAFAQTVSLKDGEMIASASFLSALTQICNALQLIRGQNIK